MILEQQYQELPKVPKSGEPEKRLYRGANGSKILERCR